LGIALLAISPVVVRAAVIVLPIGVYSQQIALFVSSLVVAVAAAPATRTSVPGVFFSFCWWES
jgi:hypothetical protein